MAQHVDKWTLRNLTLGWKEVALKKTRGGRPAKNSPVAGTRTIPAGTTAWKGNRSVRLPAITVGVKYKPSGHISGLAYFAGKKAPHRIEKRGYDLGWDNNARYTQKSWKTDSGKRRYKRVVASKVAMWLEFGNRGLKQPARPYFKRTNDEFHPVLISMLSEKMQTHYRRVGNDPTRFRLHLTDREILDVANAHKKMLLKMLNEQGHRFAENAPATIRKKKKDGVSPIPLKWTGYLSKKLKIMPANVGIA